MNHKHWCNALNPGPILARGPCFCGADPEHRVAATANVAIGGRVLVVLQRVDGSLYSVLRPFTRRDMRVV